MTNLLTRRLALFRIASVAGTAAIVAAPAALAAVQPMQSENPELLALGQHLIATADECIRLRAIKADARSQVMAAWPVLPPELHMYKYMETDGVVNETDCDGEDLNRGGETYRSIYRHYHGTKQINGRLAVLPTRGGTSSEKRERQGLKRLLPPTEVYEGAITSALDAFDYPAKSEKVGLAEWQVYETMCAISKLSALTPDGITIKAQAYQACCGLGKDWQFQTAIRIGPNLAEDVCRILSDDGEG